MPNKISMQELAEGKWTMSGDILGATWGEIEIIETARRVINSGGY